jgi:uncharacterized paraquat-inducible protein A
MREIECPKCELCFEAEEWEDGVCPRCKSPYGWDSSYNDEDGDEWIFPDWEVLA